MKKVRDSNIFMKTFARNQEGKGKNGGNYDFLGREAMTFSFREFLAVFNRMRGFFSW